MIKQLIRYRKHNRSLNIGTSNNKITFFFRDGLKGRITVNGYGKYHFGNWDK